MSLETVLLLAFFILLPLIERLVRSARQRNKGAAVPPDGRPASAGQTAIPGPQPPGVGQPRHPPAVSLFPASARQPVSATVAAGLRSPLALRRAIALMTILGPGRAIAPHEFPERDGQGLVS